MKTLSDYTRILRNTATNLNLHGDSVEMLVQMLANALYISEVEHITYSQEASLDRATLENSKIQHCVNQMYSVYRGANPRVLLNFRSTKYFQFNPHDEIIKSNNFRVYYLGYYDETSRELKYSSCTVSPDQSACIIGLIASDLYNSSWTITKENLYYKNIAVSDLSGDIVLKVNGETVTLSRIFSDHIKDNCFFDLTLPGHGSRIYYPEVFNETRRENLVNTNLSVLIYKYMSLSEIVESEKKALKMTGAVLESFPSNILDGLGKEEHYPGIIYEEETPRDGINTIHYKANKSRYTGTYLATNSDLSELLKEYYPSKVRSEGITYRFNSPASTTLETIHKRKNFTGELTLDNLKKEGVVPKELEYLPKGKVGFKYTRMGASGGENASYDIIPSTSIIPVTVKGKELVNNSVSIDISILKVSGGKTDLITSLGDLTLTYNFPGETQKVLTGGTPNIKLDELGTKHIGKNLEVRLTRGEGENEVELDKEYIPVVATPDSDQVEQETGNYYALDVSDDTLYVQTDLDGNILTQDVSFKATMYHNGEEVKDCTYSIMPISDIVASINPTTGNITVSKMGDGLEYQLIVRAEYNGVRLTNIVTVRKTIINSGNSVSVEIKGDGNTVATIEATGIEKEFTFDIPENTWKTLTMGEEIKITEGWYDYSYQELKNVYELEDNQAAVPTLEIYYIPYQDHNLITNQEKEEFVKKSKSYYVTQDIRILEGKKYRAEFNVSVSLYENTVLDETILNLLKDYSFKFGQELGDSKEGNQTETYREILSLISKIPEIKSITSLDIIYRDDEGVVKDYEEIDKDISYFDITCTIYSTEL